MFKWLLLLVIYLPFQIAFNPEPILEKFGLFLGFGIDLASLRVFIILLLLIWLIKKMISRTEIDHSRFKNLQSICLFVFLILACFSLINAENISWGIRKIIFFFSIFPLYFLVLALVDNWLKVKKIISALVKGSAFIALIGLGQFLAPFIFGLNEVYRFWAWQIVPLFSGFNFGALILSYPSWLVNVNGQVILRAFSLFSDPHMFSFYLGLILPLLVVFLGISDLGWTRQSPSGNAKSPQRELFAHASARSPRFARNHARSLQIVPEGALPSPKISFFLVIYCLLFAGLLLSFTRGAYAAISVAFLVLAGLVWRYLKKKKTALLLCFSLLIFIIPGTPLADRFYSSFDLNEGSNVGRLEMWQQAGQTGLDYFWQGVGLGNYSLVVDDAFGYRNPITAHNLYLDLFSEAGFFALLTWLILIFGTLIQLLIRLEKAKEIDQEQKYIFIGLIGSLIYFSVHSFFETSIYNPIILAVLMVVLGIATVLINKSAVNPNYSKAQMSNQIQSSNVKKTI